MGAAGQNSNGQSSVQHMHEQPYGDGDVSKSDAPDPRAHSRTGGVPPLSDEESYLQLNYSKEVMTDVGDQ